MNPSAKIFSVPDSDTSQQLAPHIQLEMPRQSQQSKETQKEFFGENNFSTTCVSHGDQSLHQYFYNCNVQAHNYYSSR